jgi:hypothetical protein
VSQHSKHLRVASLSALISCATDAAVCGEEQPECHNTPSTYVLPPSQLSSAVLPMRQFVERVRTREEGATPAAGAAA